VISTAPQPKLEEVCVARIARTIQWSRRHPRLAYAWSSAAAGVPPSARRI
jgi:hypothetical protein